MPCFARFAFCFATLNGSYKLQSYKCYFDIGTMTIEGVPHPWLPSVFVLTAGSKKKYYVVTVLIRTYN